MQYTSATGTTWQVTPLSGSLAPRDYYLIQQAAGTGGTTPLPTPDATGTIAMSETAGKVALARSTAALSGLGAGDANLVDFVGYGLANAFEGSSPTTALSSTTAALRNGDGCTDTSNAADFSVGPPNPRNSATPANTCAP